MEDGKERGHGLAAEYVHGHPKCLLDKQLHTRKVVMCICSVVARCRGCTFKRRGEDNMKKGTALYARPYLNVGILADAIVQQ